MDTTHLLNTQQNIVHIISTQINSTTHNHKYKYKESYYYDMKLEFGLVFFLFTLHTVFKPNFENSLQQIFSAKNVFQNQFFKGKSRILRNNTKLQSANNHKRFDIFFLHIFLPCLQTCEDDDGIYNAHKFTTHAHKNARLSWSLSHQIYQRSSSSQGTSQWMHYHSTKISTAYKHAHTLYIANTTI